MVVQCGSAIFPIAERLREEQGKPAGTLQRVEHHEPFTGGSYCAPAMVWEWPNGPIE